MPYCTNCGVALKENQKFCTNCGQPVNLKTKPTFVRQIGEKNPPPRETQREAISLKNKDMMAVNLKSNEIKRGGRLEGQAILNLVKPEKKGKYILLEIVAEHLEYEIDNDGESDRSFQRIYEYRQHLDGEKEYLAGPHIYDFSILIPDNIEEWRMKRESVLMKRFGFKPDQYLDKSNYDPRSLTWYLLVRFNKGRIGVATLKKTPLTFTN